MVRAGLAILWGEYRKALVLNYFSLRLESREVPSHERVVVGVCICGDKCAAPVYPAAHELQVFLGYWWEVSQPVHWVPVDTQGSM